MIDVLTEIAEILFSIKRPHPICVAIDGIDAAGKTTLADALAIRLQERGRSVSRASVDSFQNPPEIRYQRGNLSPEGYFYDSFDYEALKTQVLIPFHAADPAAILICDGVFLLLPELIDFWDIKIFIDIRFETALKRALERDAELFGSAEEVIKRYQQRYLPGQKLYLESCQPAVKADLVLDNNDLFNPILVRK
ncbi:MAG: uridine kinase [Anaerolineae bacterium]|nr:uridine kinase [Anaerolineae bacterium]